jgi:NAD(P)-dependent dehydrogenase (short-subunit alcohol dehydrogenase family)
MNTGIDVRGRVAMVTGCSSGMGRAFAKALAASGATVALCARRASRLEELSDEIGKAGGKSLVLPLDVADVPAVRAAVDTIEEKLGPLDILVNNAAVTKQAAVIDAEPEYFDSIHSINIRGAFFVAQAAARQMIRHKKHGRIVNVGSDVALKPYRRQAVYSSAKAGLIHASKVMALEWAPHNINVNVVCPGFIATEMSAGFEDTPIGKAFISTLPRKRIGQPEDLVAMVLLLCSGESVRFVTGTVIQIDDGWLLSDGADGLTSEAASKPISQ